MITILQINTIIFQRRIVSGIELQSALYGVLYVSMGNITMEGIAPLWASLPNQIASLFPLSSSTTIVFALPLSPFSPFTARQLSTSTVTGGTRLSRQLRFQKQKAH
jgi:hypothetical protein